MKNKMYSAYAEKKWTISEFQILIMASLSLLFLFIFAYLPMFGVVLAFKDGDMESNLIRVILFKEWIGFANFVEFFRDDQFISVLSNTLGLNVLMLLINFPAPIIFALLINEVKHYKFKRVIQSVSIFPHFLSWTVFGGIVLAMVNVNTGIINPILEFLRLSDPNNRVNLTEPQYFWGLIIVCSLIKGLGWGSIIYLAAISSIDPNLFEAATIDGAGRFQRIIYITLPSIAGTITLYFLLSLSNLLGNSFEQFFVMQNGVNLEASEVLSTYIYKMGISYRRFSYTAAMGLFESVIGVILLVVGNFLSIRLTGRGIFGEKETF